MAGVITGCLGVRLTGSRDLGPRRGDARWPVGVSPRATGFTCDGEAADSVAWHSRGELAHEPLNDLDGGRGPREGMREAEQSSVGTSEKGNGDTARVVLAVGGTQLVVAVGGVSSRCAAGVEYGVMGLRPPLSTVGIHVMRDGSTRVVEGERTPLGTVNRGAEHSCTVAG